MRCRHHTTAIQAAQCPETILALRDNSGIAVCRACVHGRRLMNTVRMKRQPGDFYEPETLQEQEAKPMEAPPMPEEKKSYSNKELAEAAGLTAGSIAYLIHARRHGKSSGGASMQKLQAAMKQLGVSWEDLEDRVSSRRQTRTAAAKTSPAKAIAAVQEEETDSEPPHHAAQCEEAPAAASPEYSPELEKAVDDLFGDVWEEPEDVPSPAPAFIPSAPDYVRDFSLSHIPMEALVLEITRRMPRAEVTLK